MFRLIGLMVFAGLMMVSAPRAQADDGKTLASIDLTGPFKTRSSWIFTATQGPAVADPVVPGETVPGAIALCLSHDGTTGCDPALGQVLQTGDPDDTTSGPHYLNVAKIENPDDAHPILFVQVSGFPAVNNNRAVMTQALRYDAAQDRFVVAYQHLTGHNNNQEVRYVTDGPMRGDIISAEPTEDAPFGFWITVNRLRPDGYRSVLRYRSATGYNDGNPLLVIDSEMPNLEARMGLWRPGRPLPLPPESCLRPHLVHKELWCQ